MIAVHGDVFDVAYSAAAVNELAFDQQRRRSDDSRPYARRQRCTCSLGTSASTERAASGVKSTSVKALKHRETAIEVFRAQMAYGHADLRARISGRWGIIGHRRNLKA